MVQLSVQTNKYTRKCNSGHDLQAGDAIGIAFGTGEIICMKCVVHETPPVRYSGKFCDKCFLELPLAGGPCQNCD